MPYVLAQNRDTEIIDIDFIKQYLQVDFDDDDVLIQFMWDAAKSLIESLTHRKFSEWENIPSEVIMAALLLTQNFYDNRTVSYVNEKLKLTVMDLIRPHYIYGSHWILPKGDDING